MTSPGLPFPPPSPRRLFISIASALLCAALALVVVVLPAEYGIDLTGLGKRMNLTAMHNAGRSLAIKDVIGGNQGFRDIRIPDAGQPIPLPNPAVVQLKAGAPQARTVTVYLQSGQETEVKAVLDEAQVILYSWLSDGEIYTDFHGHEPKAGDAFVRYEEQMSGHEGHGSLVAPFSGEHGWYWVNVSEKPVTITLTVTGFFRDIVNYGILR